MSDDADANVVKVIIREADQVRLVVTERVAFVTQGLTVEQLPAVLRRIIDGIPVTRHETIKRRIERQQRSFIGCNRAPEVRAIRWTSEHAVECLLIFLEALESRDCRIQIGLPHFDRIDNR